MSPPAVRELTVSDGYHLKFRHWTALNPRGIVIALHGIQSHSGWYHYSSARLADAGFSVYFADRRGAGLNGDQRGHAVHAMRLVNDARALIQLAVSESESATNARPDVTLLGISWGGKTAAALAALFPNEIDRLILLYPGLVSKIRPTGWQKLLLHFAKTFEIVKSHIPVPLDDPKLFTQSREWQQFIREDPLALHTVTSSFLNAGRDLDTILRLKASAIRHPILLMLAGDDRIIDNTAVQRLLLSTASSDTSTRIYSGCRHSLEFEPDREKIFDDLIGWLNRHPERGCR